MPKAMKRAAAPPTAGTMRDVGIIMRVWCRRFIIGGDLISHWGDIVMKALIDVGALRFS